jgi:DNA gyrase subunit A
MTQDTLAEDQLPPEGPVQPTIFLEDEMKQSYLDYAMSVIVSRALPDARDGLKPVHRRILYAMKDGGYDSSKPYKKSARIVGDVMGKYHPHGDSAIYDAMVRLAQDFSMSLPLIDGQGNFGSMDGDPAAAMRYTEARLAKAGEALLDDIDKETVAFRPNYDESVYEPVVLPSRVPNMLVNGAGGIAVGMATNIPPHNLTEVIEACCAFVDNPTLTTEDLMHYIPGPDFPTGGYIMGKTGIHKAYTTGNGSVMMRAKTSIEEIKGNREAIIVHEIPYQVNKSRLLEKIGELAREKTVEGMSEVRDESDRDGVRIVIELKKDIQSDVILNQLFRHTQLQTSFACNMLALDHGKPRTMLLRDMIEIFVKFREEVIVKRTIYELGKAREKAHILCGLAVAVANIDEVIKVIRNAPNPVEAKEQLLAKQWPAKDVTPLIALVDDPEYPLSDDGTYQMSEIQAKGILDLRLHRLTGLERDKIGDDLKIITNSIAEFLEILSNRPKRIELLKSELIEVKDKYGCPRRTELMDSEFEQDIEDLIQREDMVVTISNEGYVKRVPLDTYRAQRRGGKGRAAANMKEEDFVTDMFVASTHTPILFFTSRGIVHQMKVYQLPLGSPTSRGKAIINTLPLEKEETVNVFMRMPEEAEVIEKLDIMFATSHGTVRRNPLSAFGNIRSNGLIAMKLEDNEKMVSVKICKQGETIMLATSKGKAIRFMVEDVRVFQSRNSTGVRGIKLKAGDEVIGMSVLKGTENEQVLCVSEKGLGKRTMAEEYRIIGRGGQGVVNMALSDKTGDVVATFPVTEEHQVMLITDQGKTIRTHLHNVRVSGRSTQGVKLFDVSKDEKVMSVAWLMTEDDEEEGDVVETTDAAIDAVETDETPTEVTDTE